MAKKTKINFSACRTCRKSSLCNNQCVFEDQKNMSYCPTYMMNKTKDIFKK